MKIKGINIENFGGISNKTIQFDSGINLILGGNGSGKSVIASFIFFLFYGFTDRNDRRLKSDVNGGVSSGYALFEADNGEEYKIYRRDVNGGESSVKVTGSNRSEFTEWMSAGSTPGEYFFGVNADMMRRSSFISHRDGAVISGDFSAAARNLICSGSETENTTRALENLDSIRVELLHKNEKGGKLFDISGRIADVERKLLTASQNDAKLSVSNGQIRDAEARMKALENEAKETKEKLDAWREYGLQEQVRKSVEIKKRKNELNRLNSSTLSEQKKSGKLPNGIKAMDLKGNAALVGSVILLLAALSLLVIGSFAPSVFAGFAAWMTVAVVLLMIAVNLFVYYTAQKKRIDAQLKDEYGRSISELDTQLEAVNARLASYTEKEIFSEERRCIKAIEDAEAEGTPAPECVPPSCEAEDKLRSRMEELQKERLEISERLSMLRLNQAEELAGAPTTESLNRELSILKEEKAGLQMRLDAVKLAYSVLKKADEKIKGDVTPYLSKRAGQLLSKFTDSSYDGINVYGDVNGMHFSYLSGERETDSDYLSHGNAELAWLCIRIAMWERFSHHHRIPLILDECFAVLDDTRMSRVLTFLMELTRKNVQVIILSANKREASVLGSAAKRVVL